MKITLHPAFLAVGVLCAVFGVLPLYLICALTALLHECGHIFCAERLGFECKRVRLMPFGAAAFCDIEGISAGDEIRLALAGPAVNLFMIVLVAGLWWFFPVTYAYTDTVFYANVGMLAVNLLPAYPLDGGRVAGCVLRKFLPQKYADLILRGVCLLSAVALVLVFFLAYKNISLIALAALLVFSAFEKRQQGSKLCMSTKKKKRGREIKYVVLGEDATYKDALRYLDSSRYLVLQIYGDYFLDEISEDELFKRLQTAGIYDKLVENEA